MRDAGSYASRRSAAAIARKCSTSRSAKPSGNCSRCAHAPRPPKLKAAGGDPASDAELRLPPKSAWNMHTLDATERAHSASRRRSAAAPARAADARRPVRPGTSRASASDADAYQPRAGSLLEGRVAQAAALRQQGRRARGRSPATTPPSARRTSTAAVVRPPLPLGEPRRPLAPACRASRGEVGRPAVRPARSRGGGGRGGRGRGGAAARAVDRELQSSSLDIARRRRSPPPRSRPPPRKRRRKRRRRSCRRRVVAGAVTGAVGSICAICRRLEDPMVAPAFGGIRSERRRRWARRASCCHLVVRPPRRGARRDARGDGARDGGELRRAVRGRLDEDA